MEDPTPEIQAAIQGATVTHGRSPKVGDLVKALCRAKLRFGEIIKDREAVIPGKEGKQGYRYGYATLAAAGEATDHALAEEELNIFYSPEEGPGFFRVVTELFHSSDQYKTCAVTFELPRENIGPQGKGKLLTYGRRYGKFCILDLAPAADEDDDAASIQGRFERQQTADTLTLEELIEVAQKDQAAAFSAVRRLIASVMGCGDISEPRQRRLYAVAHSERGWTDTQLDAAVRLLGVDSVPRIPYKAYEQVVALFANSQPPQQAAVPASPPPASPLATEPLPTWDEAWKRIRGDFDDLAPADAQNCVGAAAVPAILEGFAKAGWTEQQIRDILREELYGLTIDRLPRDGSHPPVFRKVAKAFRVYRVEDVAQADRERYGWPVDGPPLHEEAPPFGDEDAPPQESSGEEDGGDIAEALALIPENLPGTADEAWRAVRAAMDAIGQKHPEALAPITPDDRMALFRKLTNGNRTSADVDALCRHYLGVRVETLPSLVFDPVQRILAGFPSRAPGREEVLGKLPADPAKAKPVELRDLLQTLVRDGVVQDEEITRSGEGGKVTKEDMIKTIERVRERALMEAGAEGVTNV